MQSKQKDSVLQEDRARVARKHRCGVLRPSLVLSLVLTVRSFSICFFLWIVVQVFESISLCNRTTAVGTSKKCECPMRYAFLLTVNTQMIVKHAQGLFSFC